MALQYMADVNAGAYCCTMMDHEAQRPLVWNVEADATAENANTWKTTVYQLCEVATLIVLHGSLSPSFLEELKHVTTEPNLRAKTAWMNFESQFYFANTVAQDWQLDEDEIWELDEISRVLEEAETRSQLAPG